MAAHDARRSRLVAISGKTL